MFERLAVASFAWFAIHEFVAGSELRWWLVRRIGERSFRGLFSLMSVASLWFLVATYRKASFYPLWFMPKPLHWLPLVIMPFALILLVGAFSVPNATAVGAENILERTDAARGVLRITRHPFLWAVALWSLVHLLVAGHLAALLFFGALLVTALRGTSNIDEKRRRTHRTEFARYAEMTSNMPFSAVILGRNRLVWTELWVPVVISGLLFAVLLYLHQRAFGFSPFGH